MLPFMFVVIVAMLFGIAGMQYLALCEQRVTQAKLDRVYAAVASRDHRRKALTDEQIMGQPFNVVDLWPKVIADTIARSLIDRYGEAA